MITNKRSVLGLCRSQSQSSSMWIKLGRTPFIKGISDAGSVDILASSIKTTGKSITLRDDDDDDIHVVQTCGTKDHECRVKFYKSKVLTTSARFTTSANIPMYMPQYFFLSAVSCHSNCTS